MRHPVMDESDPMEFYLERAEIIKIDGGRPRPDTNYAAIILTRLYCDRHVVVCPDTPDFRLLSRSPAE
ncbi:hypothetical protein OKW26_004477 [Paraburkholderia sp. 32]